MSRPLPRSECDLRPVENLEAEIGRQVSRLEARLGRLRGLAPSLADQGQALLAEVKSTLAELRRYHPASLEQLVADHEAPWHAYVENVDRLRAWLDEVERGCRGPSATWRTGSRSRPTRP